MKQICMVIGENVSASLSPVMHTAAYKYLSIDEKFFYVSRNVSPLQLPNFIDAVKLLNIKGVSITSPHKIKIMNLLDSIDVTARQIGAVNTIVNSSGKLTGYNTDWSGILKPLENRLDLNGKSISILGAGGAARAAVFAFNEYNCSVTILNRTLDKADKIAKQFNCTSLPLDDIASITSSDIIINTIPANYLAVAVGDKLSKHIRSSHIIFDINYGPQQSTLIRDGLLANATIIEGIEMLLYQGILQFELFTGLEAPKAVMQKALANQFNYSKRS